MLRYEKQSKDAPPWLQAAGRKILRLGYSDHVIGEIIPDVLRVIVETVPLELIPKAAIYLKDKASMKETLAGFYNFHWSQIETLIEPAGNPHSVSDADSKLTRLQVPITAPGHEPLGTLVVYYGTEGEYGHLEALTDLVRDLATVVTHKLHSDDEQPRSARGTIIANGSATENPAMNDNVFELLRTTIDSFPGGICVLLDDLTVAMTNRRIYEILDLPEHMFPPGCNFADILRYYAERGEYGPGDVEKLAQARIRRAKLFVDHAFDRETVSGRVLEVRTTPISGGGCILTYLDVTARKRAERELMHHRDRLEDLVSKRTAEIEQQARKLEHLLDHERRVNEQQRQFVAMASHEFRTPLAIIDGAAQRLMRSKAEITPDFIGDKVDKIRGSVSRMVGLMNSILAVGRLDHGLIDINPEPCAIEELIRSCAANQRDITPSQRFILDLDNLPETIVADRSALHQVFTNLFSNAVKYAPGSPYVFIRGWTDATHVHVSVTDRGVGIDAEDLPKMFQRYFRARTSSGIAGTGIGLNLVQQIVELHKGKISVTSKIDQGTVFTVVLPIGIEQQPNSITPETQVA